MYRFTEITKEFGVPINITIGYTVLIKSSFKSNGNTSIFDSERAFIRVEWYILPTDEIESLLANVTAGTL